MSLTFLVRYRYVACWVVIACFRSTGQTRNASSRTGLRTTSVIQEERSTGSRSSGSHDTDASSSEGEASGSVSNSNNEESDGGNPRPRKPRRRARRDVMGSPVRSVADGDDDHSQNSYDDDDYVVVESDHEVFFAAAASMNFACLSLAVFFLLHTIHSCRRYSFLIQFKFFAKYYYFQKTSR